MEKSIIIIGAGIVSLSTGCYGQMNGYRTQIFEMHTRLVEFVLYDLETRGLQD